MKKRVTWVLAAVAACVVIAALAVAVSFALREDKGVQGAPVCFRSDFVPLKVVMTDYIVDGDGDKLIKIQGSARLVVPLSECEPKRVDKCFEYTNLPRPVVDALSLAIDNQEILQNDRGFFTSQKADSHRINELRAEAARRMLEIAGSEAHVQMAMQNTADALRQFYGKFDGYSCSVQWK